MDGLVTIWRGQERKSKRFSDQQTLVQVDTTDGTHADVVLQRRGPPQQHVCRT